MDGKEREKGGGGGGGERERERERLFRQHCLYDVILP